MIFTNTLCFGDFYSYEQPDICEFVNFWAWVCRVKAKDFFKQEAGNSGAGMGMPFPMGARIIIDLGKLLTPYFGKLLTFSESYKIKFGKLLTFAIIII